MEPGIFKYRLIATIAALAISTLAFAQAKTTAVAKATTNTQIQTDESGDIDLSTSIDNLAANLQVHLTNLTGEKSKVKLQRSQRKLELAARRFNKEFKTKFKDLGQNIVGSLDELASDIDVNTNVTTNISFNSDNSNDNKEPVTKGDVTERIKNYSKTYSVDGNDLLQIDNRFGRVTVNTWNRNEFKVDVQMKFSSDDADAVNDWINGSSISDSKSGSVVSFRTNIADNNNRNGNRHQSMEINYTVYMPAGNPINIENKFGSVVLPELSGKATVRVSYGSLTAAELSNSQNDVVVKFGDANITNFNSGKVEVAYGKLKTGTVNNIDADIKFSSIAIERLRGSADVNVKYGDGFRIGTIDRTVKSINVDAQFTKINFDIKQLDSFNFDVVTKFGSFNYDDDRVKVTSKSPSDEDKGWSSTKSYKGYVGNSNTSNKIVINCSYTGVNFN